jgi:hypothetical protein
MVVHTVDVYGITLKDYLIIQPDKQYTANIQHRSHFWLILNKNFLVLKDCFIQSSKPFHGKPQNLHSAWRKELATPYILQRLRCPIIYCKT